MSHSISNSSEQSNIPYGYCQCGCGQKTLIATRNRHDAGQVKGEPNKFVRGHGTLTKAAKAKAAGEKACAICQKIKPLSEFRLRNSGARAGSYYSYCFECDNAKRRAGWRTDEEFRQERRQAHREYYVKNKELVRQRYLERRASSPELFREYTRVTRSRNPLRAKAHSAVNAAVRRGLLPPAWTMVCEECQEAQSSHWHHHKGYADEYKRDVIALCTECHGATHRIE